MAESFNIKGPVRVPGPVEHYKINYQEQRRSKKGQSDDAERSPFQKLMQKEPVSKTVSKITPEKICERVLPKCKIYLIDYEKIIGLRQKNYPIDLFFQDGTTTANLLEPRYLDATEQHPETAAWQAMIQRCQGNAVLIHPQQWEKMAEDLEYAVMLTTEVRSVLAKEYAESDAYPNRICLSCVIGIDQTGLAVLLFSTGENYKHEGIPAEKIMKLRKLRMKKSDEERKQEFIKKLRQQKKGLEKYRYDTAVMKRVKMTAKLFDADAISVPDKGQKKTSFFQDNEASISLMELITGGL